MSTSRSADISIIFVWHLEVILIFVLTLCVICVSTSDSVRLRIIANLCLVFDLYYYANIFIRVCISKHGCTSTDNSISLHIGSSTGND